MAGALEEFDALGNLDGLVMAGFMPDFAELFAGAVAHGSEIVKYRQPWKGRIVTISVFPISVGKFAGAVVQDVTKNEGRREEIAAKARDVIRKNVYTVQQVARLFGERRSRASSASTSPRRRSCSTRSRARTSRRPSASAFARAVARNT